MHQHLNRGSYPASSVESILHPDRFGLPGYWVLSNLAVGVLLVVVGISIVRRYGKTRRLIRHISHKELPVINDYLDPFFRPIERIFNRWKWARYSLLVVAVIIPATLFLILIQSDRSTVYWLTPERDPTDSANMSVEDRETWRKLTTYGTGYIGTVDCDPAYWKSPTMCDTLQRVREVRDKEARVREIPKFKRRLISNYEKEREESRREFFASFVPLAIIYGVGLVVVFGTRKLRKYRGGLND